MGGGGGGAFVGYNFVFGFVMELHDFKNMCFLEKK